MKIVRNIFITLLVLFLVLLYTPLIQKSASPLIVEDTLEKADAIVILSEGWEKDEALSLITLENYRYGMKLFQQGQAPIVIFSGGNLIGEPAEADIMEEMALDEGFPPQAMISENAGKTTHEKVLFTTKILQEKELDAIILVASPYRTFRAKEMFQEKNVQVISAPVNGYFQKANGLERIKLAKLIFIEYGKLLIYKLFTI